MAVLVAILVAAPVVGAIASLLGRSWYASSDQALQLLRISDVGGSHTPLLGAWSRWGWAHPGPLQFWLLAPFYRLLGETGVLAGTAILNLVCMLAVVLIGYRRGGARLAILVGLMTALLAHGSGALLIDPWNPWAAFFPFVVFLLLVWSVLCGDLLMLPIAIAIGSLSVQTHAGYLPLVGGLLALAVMWCVVAMVREREREPIRRSPAARWLAIAAGVGVVVWLPAIIDQLSGGNNLRALLSYSQDPVERSVGWNAAFGAMGLELRPNGAWVTGHDTGGLGFLISSSAWPGIITLGAVVASGLFAWRRGHGDAARLALLSFVATGLAVVATSRVTGIFVPYVVHWWWAVAAIAMLSIVWCMVAELKAPNARHAVSLVGLAGLVVTTAVMLRDLPPPVPGERLSRMVEAVGPPTAAALDHEHRYLVRGIDPSTWGSAPNGLYFDLYRRGFDVFVDPDEFSSLRHGTWRQATPREVDAMVMVIDLPDVESGAWQPPPGSRLVASFDPLAPAERARARELEASIRASLGSNAPPGRISVGASDFLSMKAQGVSRQSLEELNALQQLGDAYVVYVTPPPLA
ncbi:MAG: hypothetical protein QOI95_2949 [Acidimicrobiaceae bacterium]